MSARSCRENGQCGSDAGSAPQSSSANEAVAPEGPQHVPYDAGRVPGPAAAFDSTRWSVPHAVAKRWRSLASVARLPRVLAWPATVTLSYGSILLVACCTRARVAPTSAPEVRLPLLADINTLWQFGVTLPILVMLFISESEHIAAGLNSVLKSHGAAAKGTLRTWSSKFAKWNIIAQVVASAFGVAAAWLNYTCITQPEWGSWQTSGEVVNAAGWVWLIWFAFFWAAVPYYGIRSLLVVVLLRDLAQRFSVKPIVFHPDNCGGLRAIGFIGLRHQYLLAAGGINVLLLALVASRFPPSIPMYIALVSAAVICLTLGPAAFLGPLLPFRKTMAREKETVLDKIGRALEERTRHIQCRLHTDGVPEAEGAAVERLLKFRALAKAMPVWPFDVDTLRKFITAYVGPILAMLASPGLDWLIKVLTRWSR